ncbi:MAG TPA: hypothetical protein VFT48_20830 [Pyrinomonadaceae bacterium]|nr:hypothetical protein [Pyrinomonadaceae bacterium]
MSTRRLIGPSQGVVRSAANARRKYAGVLTKITLGREDAQTYLTDICEGTNVAALSYYLARKRTSTTFTVWARF